MIKINLLPHLKAKRAKRQTVVQYQMMLLVGLLVVIVGGLGYFWFYLDNRVEALQGQQMALNNRLNALKAKVQEVENFERDKKSFEEKIEIIRQLKVNQGGPVQLLDQVSRSLPTRVWLVKMSQRGNQLAIEGKALTNSVLVDFIDQLKQSNLFSDVQLLESRQIQEKDVPVYNFRLNCLIKL